MNVIDSPVEQNYLMKTAGVFILMAYLFLFVFAVTARADISEQEPKYKKPVILTAIGLTVVVCLVLFFTDLIIPIASVQSPIELWTDIKSFGIIAILYPFSFLLIVYSIIELVLYQKKQNDDRILKSSVQFIITGVGLALITLLLNLLRSLQMIPTGEFDFIDIGNGLLSIFILIAYNSYYFIFVSRTVEKTGEINREKAVYQERFDRVGNLITRLKSATKNYQEKMQSVTLSLDSTRKIVERDMDLANNERGNIKNFSTTIIENIRDFEDILNSMFNQNQKVEDFFNLIQHIIKISKDINNRGKVVSGGVVNLSSVIAEAKNKAIENCKIIMEIKKSIESIVSINQTIDKISEESNTLSMNAAIEAANNKGGGFGFKVVSDDLRNLATQTKNEIHKIEDILRELNQDFMVGLQSAQSVKLFFVELEQTIEKIFNYILNIVNQTKDLISEIDYSQHTLNSLMEITKHSSELGLKQKELNNDLNDTIIDLKFNFESIRRGFESESSVITEGVGSANTMLDRLNENIRLIQKITAVYTTIDSRLNSNE